MTEMIRIQVWTPQEPAGASSATPEAYTLTAGQAQLRQMVLASVTSPHSRRNYAKALDLLFAFAAGRPLTRALVLACRTSLEELAPSTVNVRLAAVRKLVSEAQKNGMLSVDEAAGLSGIPNIPQKGTRLGNWLTKEQARELLAVPDRSTPKGKRDYCILALLVGFALRRRELASLTVEDIQMREHRWVIADLRGRGGRIRTVAVPVWVENGINAWQTAARSKRARCCVRSGRAARSGRV